MTSPKKQHARTDQRAAADLRRDRFVREYLIDLNAAAAARRAGFSARSSKQLGRNLMKEQAIKTAIADLIAERATRAKVKADDVIAELHVVAFDPEHSAQKVRALEILAKHLGLLDDRFIVTGAGGGPIEVNVTNVRDRIASRLARLALGN